MDERELHARVSALFQRVVDLEDQEREQILTEEQGHSGGPLVVQRVRSLLDVNADSDTERPLDAASLLGQEIKDYEVLEILDEGGMGVVYRARRLDPMEEVAIKVLSAGPVTAELLERFHTEVQLLASCDHPGIVRYRDSGELRGGRPYLIMDLVDGPPLSLSDPAVRAGVKETVDLVIHAASAVQHLHARLALHRDLKPSNLLITRGPDGPRPVLIDLGIARPLDEDEIDLTQGRVLGTPAFMSPEQAEGQKAHAPTDVYGLGAVLYLLLTGVPPRDLHEVAASDIEERRRRLNAPAIAPSLEVRADEFGPAAAARARRIRGDLDAVVMQALETRPKDRYESVEALRSDLVRWHAGRPVLAHPIGWRGRTWRLMKRYPTRITTSALVVLTLAIFAVVTRRSLVEARDARADLVEQLDTTTAIRDFVIQDVFQQASPELEGPETPVREIVQSAADAIGPEIDERPALAVGLRSTLVVVFSTMGDLERAREQVELTRPIADKLPLDHPQRMEYDVEVGLLAQHQGQATEAIEVLREVLPRIREAEFVGETLLPRAVIAYALALLENNELAESLRLHREAIELLPEGDQARWSLGANICMLVSSMEGAAGAIPDYESLLAGLREHFHPRHVYIMGVGSQLVSAYLTAKQPEKALPLAREVMDIANETFEPDSLDRLTILSIYGSTLSALEDYEQAVPVRKEVFETRQEVLGDSNPQVSLAAVTYSSTLSKAGQHDEALELARFAVSTIEAQGRQQHPDAGYAHQALGVALVGTGAVLEALEALDEAIAILSGAEGNHTARIASIEKKKRELAVD